jgi:superfamily II DNA or RNA helicase
MAAGPIRHKVKSSSEGAFKQEVQVHQLYDTPPLHLTLSEERPKISDAYRWIMENENRTQRIVSDVINNVREAKHPIVLTERREHAETINNLLKERGVNSIILKGAMKAAERKRVDEHLHSAQVVVATGKYVGEGFDLPRLDTRK